MEASRSLASLSWLFLLMAIKATSATSATAPAAPNAAVELASDDAVTMMVSSSSSLMVLVGDIAVEDVDPGKVSVRTTPSSGAVVLAVEIDVQYPQLRGQYARICSERSGSPHTALPGAGHTPMSMHFLVDVSVDVVEIQVNVVALIVLVDDVDVDVVVVDVEVADFDVVVCSVVVDVVVLLTVEVVDGSQNPHECAQFVRM